MPIHIFIFWFIFSTLQIILFSIFLFKKNIKSSVDIIPIVNYNNMTYWKDGEILYKEERGKVTMSKKNAQEVNQLNSGLNPSELMYIIEMLEEKL